MVHPVGGGGFRPDQPQNEPSKKEIAEIIANLYKKLDEIDMQANEWHNTTLHEKVQQLIHKLDKISSAWANGKITNQEAMQEINKLREEKL